MKKITILAMSIGMFVLGCTEKTEIGTTGDIKGIVKNTDGTPLSDAVVILDSVTAINTMSDGAFAFLNVKPTAYQVTVKKRGYQKIKQTLSLNAGDTQIVDFTLNSFTPILILPANAMNIANACDSAKIQISANFIWEASNNAESWLMCSPKNGQNSTLTITWTANITKTPRTGMILFTDEYDTVQTISIVQEPGAKAYTFVYLNTAYPGWEVGTDLFAIKSNVAWTAKGDGWFTCYPAKGFNDGTIYVSWPENKDKSGWEKKGVITVTAEGGYRKDVTFIQDCYVEPYIPPCTCCPSNNEYINEFIN